jgi:hypothetical protein
VLNCQYNQLTTLTVISGPLYHLDCSHNLLTSLTTDFVDSTFVDEFELSLKCAYNNFTSFTIPAENFYEVELGNNPFFLPNALHVSDIYCEK